MRIDLTGAHALRVAGRDALAVRVAGTPIYRGPVRARALATRNQGGLVLASDGLVWVWGAGIFNDQLGTGHTTNQPVPIPMPSPWAPASVVQIAGRGAGGALLLASDGTVWSWGHNGGGQNGNGLAAGTQPLPGPVTPAWGGRRIVQITGRVDAAAALADDGTVWAWGAGVHGGLGVGDTTNRSVPVQVTPTWGGRRIVQITGAGPTGFFALDDDGGVWAWGSGAAGRLGNGTTTAALTPVQVTAAWGAVGSVQIAARVDGGLALTDDGAVWSWGGGGQNGDGGTADAWTPVRVEALGTRVVSIAGRANGAHAVLDDGTAWSWGTGDLGANGNGTTAAAPAPVPVTATWGTRRVVAVVGRSNQGAHALLDDGTVWGWGGGSSQQLGTGSIAHALTPTQVTATWDGVMTALTLDIPDLAMLDDHDNQDRGTSSW